MEKLIAIFLLSIASHLVLGEDSCPSSCDCETREIKGSNKKVIDCSNRGLSDVPSFVYMSGESYDYLFLNNNKITNLQSRAFRGLKVKHMDISGNQIRGVSDNAFKSMSGLQELIAEDAGLSSAPIALAQLERLHILKLKNNSINVLNARVFNPLKHLHYLDVSNNRLDFPSPFNGFSELRSLKTLMLAGCEIDNMPVDALEDVSPKLKLLDLSNNNIRDIPQGALHQMYKLEQLNLENNPITFHQEHEYFKGLTNLKVLKLGKCDMGGQLNMSVIKDNSRLKTFSVHTCNIKKVEKNFFQNLRHLQHLDIGGNNIKLTTELFSGVSGRLLSVGLGNMSLTGMPRFLFGIFGKVKNISLAHNKMERIPAGSFANLPQSGASIDLSNNGVIDVNVHFLRGAKRPISVDLSNNNIKDLTFITANPCNFEGADLNLKNNPLQCNLCGTVIAMQRKLFDAQGICAGPRGVIGYHLMWKPGYDPLPKYLERNASQECGLENKENQRYLCCQKRWVQFDSSETCGTNQISAFYVHILVVLILGFIMS